MTTTKAKRPKKAKAPTHGGARPGAGRKLVGGYKRSVNLPEDLGKAVDAIATANAEPFNAAIVRLLRAALGGGAKA